MRTWPTMFKYVDKTVKMFISAVVNVDNSIFLILVENLCRLVFMINKY